jgi:3',5'-cyclic AMP phosphodiesterase CpdA
VTVRILHVSDLHAGRRESPETFAAVQELAARLRPELVLATGDLAHRGRRAQLERAQELLAGMGAPVLAVPGNHDLPYTVPARFTRPFREWERVFGTVEPVYSSERLVVAGLSSARPWRQQGGALTEAALARAASLLGTAPPGALRVVALHHHLAAPPWRPRRKQPLRGRDRVLRRLAEAGAELVVGGHVHQAAVAARREFEAVDGARGGSLVLATAPGLGRPRPRRAGEACGLNVYEAGPDTLEVTTFTWQAGAFREVGRRTFPRG